jgi:hypothetical protein
MGRIRTLFDNPPKPIKNEREDRAETETVHPEGSPFHDGFCRQCGHWLFWSQMIKGFCCPTCGFNVFSINRIGARERWEEGRREK